MAQYAAAGIPAYVVVRMSADGDIIDTREFHLDAATCHAHTRQSCALGRRAGWPHR
jgi:hypothetical protein